MGTILGHVLGRSLPEKFVGLCNLIINYYIII